MVAVDTRPDRAEWSAIVDADPFAVPEHAPMWADAMCAADQWSDATRLYRFADGRSFVLPLVRRRGPSGVGGRFAAPAPAWGIGGIAGADLDAGVTQAIVGDLASLGAAQITIRPNPLRAACYAPLTGRRVVRIPRRTHVIDLADSPATHLAGLNKSTRKGIRRAEAAGVEVRVERSGRLLDVHYELYLTSVQRWAQHQHEPIALARWRALRRDPLSKLRTMADCAGERFRHLVAYVDGVPAASNILLLGTTTRDTRGAMDRELAQSVHANDLLQWRSIVEAYEHGSRWYNLGETGTSTALATFKERFGAVGMPYDEIRIERFPITRTDAALRSGVKRVIGFRD
jgi:hypothetical protein